MSIEEIARKSLKLPTEQRAELATRILQSLPPRTLDADPEGIAEALRRDEEMDSDPSASMSDEGFLATKSRGTQEKFMNVLPKTKRSFTV